MALNIKSAVSRAVLASPWDEGNKVLYDLCKKYPLHDEVPYVIAKVWLIGRSYAAAIERGRKKSKSNSKNNDPNNDDFYVKIVGPKIAQSEIDKWIKAAKNIKRLNAGSLVELIKTHYLITNLFKKISGKENRSLASKYLHFHVPQLFFIYDTRAVKAIGKLSTIIGRVNKSNGYYQSDNDYRKFAEKCFKLQRYIKSKYGIYLNPRQLDKLLLNLI